MQNSLLITVQAKGHMIQDMRFIDPRENLGILI